MGSMLIACCLHVYALINPNKVGVGSEHSFVSAVSVISALAMLFAVCNNNTDCLLLFLLLHLPGLYLLQVVKFAF